MQFNDLTNKTYGKLTVIGPHRIVPYGTLGRSKTEWFCQCQCGKKVWRQRDGLIQGQTDSCGCNKRIVAGKGSPAAIAAAKTNTTHGMSGTKVYVVWSHMLARCNNPKEHSYPTYGAKGIRVCERWQTFENFLTDMGQPPDPNYIIDRKNPYKNYTPQNCRWIKSRSEGIKRNTPLLPSGEMLVRFCERHKLAPEVYQALYHQFTKKRLPWEEALDFVRKKYHISSNLL